MADNTDTELLDWLNKQQWVEINHRLAPHTYQSQEWFVRINGGLVFHSDLRTALRAFKDEIKGEANTASKGE